MTKLFLFWLVVINSSLAAQISKIEHFFLSSPKADSLFKLFTTKLGTPIVWDYQVWGDFSSGGVSLGNVAFEFVNYEGVNKTKFEGIALESKQSVEEFIKILDAESIQHDAIQSNTYVAKDGSIAGWSTLSLKNLLPDEAGLFICDYKKRKETYENRKKSSDSLKMNKGGPIGIIFLKEIVIGSSNYSLHKSELTKLPGVITSANDVFSFEQGPAIRLKKSDTNEIQKIILKVFALDVAKQYLKSQNLLEQSSGNGIYINSKTLDGLLIELTDK